MDAFESLFARTLAAKIAESREARVLPVVNGTIQSLETYRHFVGYIQALDDVRHMMEEIARKLIQPETANETDRGRAARRAV